MAAVESELAALVISPSRNKLEVLGQFRGWLCIFLHTFPNGTLTANICSLLIVHLGQF